MTLAEWRAAVDGYLQIAKERRYEQAWIVSHLLVAAGCEAEKVTPAKLLGEKEKKPRRTPIFDPDTQRERDRKKIMERIRAQAGKQSSVEPRAQVQSACK